MSLIEMPGVSVRTVPSYKPYGQILQLDWTPVEKMGELHIPVSAQKKFLPFYRVPVLEAGPECKLVKKGDHVLLPAEAILSAPWDGYTAYFSHETKVMAVVELKPATPTPSE